MDPEDLSPRGTRIPPSVRPALVSMGASTITLVLVVAAVAAGPERGYHYGREFTHDILTASTIAYALITLAWLIRAVLAWISAAAAPSPAKVTAYRGVSGGRGRARIFTYGSIVQITFGATGAVRYQRVMWDPVLDRMPPDLHVQARVRGWGPTRRAVIDLPNGTRIWPAGRLRHREPWFTTLTRREHEESKPPRPQLVFILLAVFAGLQLSADGLDAGLVGISANVGIAVTGVILWWAWTGGDGIPGGRSNRDADDQRPVWLTRTPTPRRKPYRQINGGRGRRKRR
jgi:hypothetical protein